MPPKECTAMSAPEGVATHTVDITTQVGMPSGSVLGHFVG